MAQLSSPGVSVTVIDESFYTPAAPGTVPLIFVTSQEGKQNASGTGTAAGTLATNAGKVYLLTSQKDLADTFGTPVFQTDANNNPVHAGELNEYGLQAAYSYLGVSNRAYVVRADVDLAQLEASADAPMGDPANGTYWFDTASTEFGIFEWNAAAATAGGQKFVNKRPTVITDTTKVVNFNGGNYTPKASIGAIGDYALVAVTNVVRVWYKNDAGTWVEVGSEDWLTSFTGTPSLAIQPHTSVPQWKATAEDAITGSVWIKTTEPNLGARWRVKVYSDRTGAWSQVDAPIYVDNTTALQKLDSTGGGSNLAAGALYVKYNVAEDASALANFKIYKRKVSGMLTVTSNAVLTNTFTNSTTYSFLMAESLLNNAEMSATKTITFSGNASATDAESFAEAINTAGFVNVVAEVDGLNRVVITHKLGGDITFAPSLAGGVTNPIPLAFSTASTANFYADPTGASNTFVGSLWTELAYSAGPDAPTTIPADGRLWYNSMIDEVDIMIHDASGWKGYRNVYPDTDINGPQVSATAPVKQSDGTTPLADGDLWIDTSDLENFPRIYRFDAYKTNVPTAKQWVLLDNSDQTTENGVLFADARWGTSGGTADAPADSTIQELLSSDFLDFDAPDPALYPQGMLLWNLRRSGFNVKRFVQNYVDTTADNHRMNDVSMSGYYPHRWVSEAGNQENGAGTFGRKAQRKVVVQKLQALVNSNQQIRDEESRIFNLIACPGYPELIGEMVSLNYDRGLTAFIVGDTPARLTPDATSLSNWGMNVNGALEDNDQGLVSFDEYLGCFYPWGYTSDNIGNNVVVPPSHMMLRTIALNDEVSYPWFAPAGTRRGGITNATAVGYITSEGEFQSVALNNGQRDTLASVKVNPLTFITGTGLVNYGQFTRAKNASSLDRINVARLVIYLRRQFAQLAKPYVFEPNDKITRDEIKGAAESLLLELVGQRALYDYIVVCDESNNTPARIDRNELYLDVAIEPVKAVEFIYIPLRLKNTGEIKGLQ